MIIYSKVAALVLDALSELPFSFLCNSSRHSHVFADMNTKIAQYFKDTIDIVLCHINDKSKTCSKYYLTDYTPS